jgi:single-strand DNA-binding protein
MARLRGCPLAARRSKVNIKISFWLVVFEESFMAGSVNKVILIGNLGRDPEVRRMNSGDSVVSFSVATTESWRDKMSGERKERTEWHNVVIFNENLGKIAEQYCKKGSKVYLEGQLQTREYQDKDGNPRKVTEVVLQRFRGELTLLDSRGRGEMSDGDSGGSYESSGGSFGRQSPMEKRPATAGSGRMADVIDDDIPF